MGQWFYINFRPVALLDPQLRRTRPGGRDASESEWWRSSMVQPTRTGIWVGLKTGKWNPHVGRQKKMHFPATSGYPKEFHATWGSCHLKNVSCLSCGGCPWTLQLAVKLNTLASFAKAVCGLCLSSGGGGRIHSQKTRDDPSQGLSFFLCLPVCGLVALLDPGRVSWVESIRLTLTGPLVLLSQELQFCLRSG